MRYISKGESPEFFEKEKQLLVDDPAWDNLHCKRELRLHLIKEQKGLCVYCERGIDDANSHVEHLFAQSDNPVKRFDYGNLVASCNGDQCDSAAKDSYKPEDVHSCGHKKSDDLDVDKFLNPILHGNIGHYFVYDKEKCSICTSGKDDERAIYTIKLLNLDNHRLNNERANARLALEKTVKMYPDRKEKIRFLLSKERAFISFLCYYFAPFLVESP